MEEMITEETLFEMVIGAVRRNCDPLYKDALIKDWTEGNEEHKREIVKMLQNEHLLPKVTV